MNFCKDCRHCVRSEHEDKLMQLATCALTEWEHPVTGEKKRRNCFDERMRSAGCGTEALHFAPRLEVA